MEAVQVEIPVIKAGDVFHFRYHPAKEQGWDSRTHCFEGILVAKEGDAGFTLHDTYWNLDGRDGRSFTPVEAMRLGTITHYCNLNEIEQIDGWRRNYYADEDVIWLHTQNACSKSCQWYYKRKGAVYSKEKMLDVVNENIRAARSKLDSAMRDIEYQSEIKGKIESGDLDVYL